MPRFRFYHAVLAGLLLVGVAGCWPAPDEPVPAALVPMIVAARQDPAATVGLFYEFFIQKNYAPAELLVTEELAKSYSYGGRLSYAEVHRRSAYTQGSVTRQRFWLCTISIRLPLMWTSMFILVIGSHPKRQPC
jgi:hypothetical protein